MTQKVREFGDPFVSSNHVQERPLLLKLKPGVTEEQAARLQESVLALKDTIPGILKASVGKDFISRSKGFDIGWVFEFANREDLEVYSKHPAHLAFIEKHGVHREDIILFDYEVNE
ncbi:unnamed protein product [Umbelopsis vinacea]